MPDEIQECKEARTALKSFKMDGRFDVIATSSLLGVKGYGQRKDKSEGEDSVPVGYETLVEMYPLDFDEFLWANGIGTNVILVRFKGKCVLVEVKAKTKTGKAKSMSTVLKNKNIYNVNNGIKLGQYNVGREGDVLTIPLYMGFLIKDKLPASIIPDVDLSQLTT